MTAAYVMTYDNLVADIPKYLERTDTATLNMIPTFIGLTEQKIATQLKILGNLTVQTSNLVQGQNIIDKPARWHKTVSFNVTVAGRRKPIFLRSYEYLREYKTVSFNVTVAGRRKPIFLRSYEYLREYWPEPANTDEPKFYADYDYTHWIIAPTPDDDYAFEILYYERIQPLDSSNQTNWFTIYAPNALLFGSLMEAAKFLKNPELVNDYQAQYDFFMQALTVENKLRVADRQAVVVDS